MKYFKKKEFNCPCCSNSRIKKEFEDKIDTAREYANVPFIITSGYRCDEHNKKVGGSVTSSHLKGLACDIACENSQIRYNIINGLIKAGFTRIGIAKNFIHVDCDSTKPNCIWTY